MAAKLLIIFLHWVDIVLAMSDTTPNLRNAARDRELMAYLQRRLEALKDALVIEQDETILRQLQGGATEVARLINKLKRQQEM